MSLEQQEHLIRLKDEIEAVGKRIEAQSVNNAALIERMRIVNIQLKALSSEIKGVKEI